MSDEHRISEVLANGPSGMVNGTPAVASLTDAR
jgi:hypothetical protein